MKKTLTFVSMLALAACSGGDGGSLHPTHGTSTGGASNQPAYYANFKQYFDNVIKNTTLVWEEDTINSPVIGEYKYYGYKINNKQHSVNEKEMQLVNYGTHGTCDDSSGTCYEVSTEPPYGYIHNREAVGANLYTPVSGTTFTGGTLAYLVNPNNNYGGTSRLLGNVTYTYNPTNPELTLAFDRYYTFNIEKNGTNKTVTVSGTSSVNPTYDLTPGTYTVQGNNTDFTATHLQKGVQEAAGTYQIKLGNGDNLVGNASLDFSIYGAFGGTHE